MARETLTRSKVLDAALRLADAQGLGGLSMRKLAAELGVEAMSLYNHVANKRDLLDGVVELLWTEIEDSAPAKTDWRAGYRSFANAVRDAVHRHPNAAPLITSQQVIPEPALRCVHAHVTSATNSDVTEGHAYALLRTISSYALGTALNEVAWNVDRAGCLGAAVTRDLVRPGVPEELAEVAEVFCGQSNADAEFALGLELMLRPIDSESVCRHTGASGEWSR